MAKKKSRPERKKEEDDDLPRDLLFDLTFGLMDGTASDPPLTVKRVKQVFKKAAAICQKESHVLEVTGPVVIVGDIHGDSRNLFRILSHHLLKDSKKEAFDLSQTYVFLGDYVDKGTESLRTILLLALLKILMPNNFVLVRGNHEFRPINSYYGHRKDCVKIFGKIDGNAVWNATNEMFDSLSLSALINGRFLCMHGGLSPAVKSLQLIRKNWLKMFSFTKLWPTSSLPKPLRSTKKSPVAYGLVWCDPDVEEIVLKKPKSVYRLNDRRKAGYYFSEAAAEEFMDRNGLFGIFRGHQAVPFAFQFFANRRVLTLYGTNTETRHTACLQIDRTGMPEISQFQNEDEETLGSDALTLDLQD